MVANANGSANITFQVFDGTLTASRSFALSVIAVNDAPTVAAIADKSTNEDTSTTAIAVTVSDIDGPSQTCNATYLSYTSTTTSVVASSGAVTWGDTWPNCTATIAPVANGNGTSTIGITASDGTLTSAAQSFVLTVNVVNDAPTISDVSNQSTDEDTALNNVAVTIGDIESTLTCAGSLSASSSNTSLLPNGNISIGGTALNCTVSMSPAANQNGTATVTLTVTDGSLNAQDTFLLTVNSINDAPTNIALSNNSIDENGDDNEIVGTLSASDIDTSSFTFSLVSGDGDTNNGLFNISGNSLLATTALDYETTPTPNVRIAVSDGTNTYEKSFSITVNDNYYRSVAAGGSLTLEVLDDGTLWSVGFNESGQLGIDSTTNQTAPGRVGSAADWKAVFVNQVQAGSTFGIRTNGNLWAWGSNSSGQLGIGNTTQETSPVQVGSSAWKFVAPGSTHILGVQSDASLWAWGLNTSGQVGNGNTASPQSIPVAILAGTTWKAAAAGCVHSLAVKSDGTLWAWGSNSVGQVGDGTTIDVTTGPKQIGIESTWMSVAAAYTSSFAIKSDGTLWAWGANNVGQLGDGTTTDVATGPKQIGTDTNWKKISSAGTSNARTFSLAIKTDGTLWAWGVNTDGNLGIGNHINQWSPTQVGSATNWKRAFAGSGKTNVTTHKASSAALKTDGSFYTWGDNYFGQLSTGSAINYRTSAVQVGTSTNWQTLMQANVSNSSFVIKSDNTLWGWGYNSSGELGNGDALMQLSPIQIGTDANWQTLAISSNGGRAFGIKSDGTLFGWGTNPLGQLGDGTTTTQLIPVRIGTDADWSKISTCSNTSGQGGHTLALKTDGTLWAWGTNGTGQIGNSTTTNVDTGPLKIGTDTDWKTVSAGCYSSSVGTSYAVKNNGTLWAWGSNSVGQVGDGTTIDVTTGPKQIGTDTDWKTIATAIRNSYAIKTDGSLYAWGLGTASALGTCATANQTTPARVGTDTNWSLVAPGASYAQALKTDGTRWAWGGNTNGQLGDGTTTTSACAHQADISTNWSSVSVGYKHGLGTKADATLWSWGDNSSGQLADPATAPAVTPRLIWSP
jgi:alpha-tubulin suppressor-like RCC1 family protein